MFAFVLLRLVFPYQANLCSFWRRSLSQSLGLGNVSEMTYFRLVDLGFDPGEICTKLKNGSYDAEFNGEQHIKSPQKSPVGNFFRGRNSKWLPENL